MYCDWLDAAKVSRACESYIRTQTNTKYSKHNYIIARRKNSGSQPNHIALSACPLHAIMHHPDSGKNILGDFREVRRDDAAIGRQEGVGAVAEVFGKAQRMTLIGE